MSKYDKVYMFDFYRILSVKKRFWSFKSAKDIRPCLSTLLKFLEAVIPFIKDKVKGILITMPSSTDIKKYHKLLSFGLRKSYLKIFNAVEAQHSPDSKINQFNNFMFLSRKGSDPNQLFKTSMFKKNYTFGYLDTEFLDTVEPKTFQKDSVSLKVDKKFAFGKMEINMLDSVDVQIPDMEEPKKYTTQELLKLTGKPVTKEKVSGSVVDVEKLTQEKYAALKMAAIEEPKVHIVDTKEFNKKYGVDSLEQVKSTGSIMGVIVSLRSYKGLVNDKTKSVPFAKMKEHIEYSFKTKASEKVKNTLIAAGVFNKDGTLKHDANDFEYATREIYKLIDSGELDETLHNKTQEGIIGSYNIVGEYVKYSVKTDDELKQEAKKEAEKEAGISKDTGKIPNAVRTKVEMPVEIKSTVPGFDTIDTYENNSPLAKTKYGDVTKFHHDEENVNLKVSSVLTMPEVNEWYNKFDSLSGKVAIRRYCGPESGTMNDLMKKFSMGTIDAKDLSPDIRGVVNHFINYAPALERGIWVYRNGRIGNLEKSTYGDDMKYDDIKAGAHFTNATIMSTSVRSTQSIGSYRMKHLIYLPAGTRCLPVFGKVTHSGENEILLPPMSSFKIIDCWDYRPDTNPMFLIKSIYIGSSIESLQEMIKNGGKLDMGLKAVTEAQEAIRRAREKLYGR